MTIMWKIKLVYSKGKQPIKTFSHRFFLITKQHFMTMTSIFRVVESRSIETIFHSERFVSQMMSTSSAFGMQTSSNRPRLIHWDISALVNRFIKKYNQFSFGMNAHYCLQFSHPVNNHEFYYTRISQISQKDIEVPSLLFTEYENNERSLHIQQIFKLITL